MDIFYKISFSITAIEGILIVTALSFRRPIPKSNFLYLWLNLAMLIWAAGRYALLEIGNYEIALLTARFLYFGSVMVHVFFLHTVLVLLNREKENKGLVAAFYINALIILFFNIWDITTGSNFFVKDVVRKLGFQFFEVPGPVYYLHLINYLFIPLYVFIELIRSITHSQDAELQQRKYILSASVLGFIGGNSVVPLIFNIPVQPVLVIFVPLHLIWMYLAITKHRLFNIKVIATELLTFGIWIFLLVRTLLATNLQERIIDGSLLVLVVFFGILLIRSVLKEVKQREQLEALSKELAAANEELKKLDAAKSEFISIAGHQLRAPLTVIKGYVSMLLEGTLGKISELAGESMKKVAISAEQLVKLIADMLDLSRIEGGRMHYEFKNVVFDDIVAEVVAEVEQVAKSKGLGLTFANHNSAKRPVKADPDKIREVVMNLIDNAIKYTSEGRVLVELATEKKDSRDWLRLKVQDTGLGIKAEDIPRMFTKFARTEEAKRIRPDGMGLGLYVAKKIVEDHGGRVWVESAGLGKGSTFFVEVPVV